MNILIYWEQESWGGVDSHLINLLSSWPNKEDDKIILVVNKNNEGFQRIKPQLKKLKQVVCLELHSISINQLVNRWRRRPYLNIVYPILHFLQPIVYFLCVRKFSKFIKNNILRRFGRIDIVLGNNGSYPGAWGTLCFCEASMRCGIKNNILLVHHSATKPLPFMSWYEQLIDRRFSKILTAIISVSRATRATLLENRFFKEELINLRVIHNQITNKNPNTSELKPLNLKNLIKARKEDLIVGIVGRVVPYKGHADLLFGLSRLKVSVRKKIHLVVIGNGDSGEVNRLKEIARNLNIYQNVHFLGYVEEDPFEYIKQFDLLAMVTRTFEGFGLTILEAIIVGTPVMATRVGAVEEFLNVNTATLINPSSPDEIKNVFQDLVSNNVTFQTKAVNAKIEVKNNPKSMAEEYRYMFSEGLQREN